MGDAYKAIFPSVALGLVCIGLVSGLPRLVQDTALSSLVRVLYTILYTVTMEFVARVNHARLWHTRVMWWIHGTHHHQYPAIGSAPCCDQGNKCGGPPHTQAPQPTNSPPCIPNLSRSRVVGTPALDSS